MISVSRFTSLCLPFYVTLSLVLRHFVSRFTSLCLPFYVASVSRFTSLYQVYRPQRPFVPWQEPLLRNRLMSLLIVGLFPDPDHAFIPKVLASLL